MKKLCIILLLPLLLTGFKSLPQNKNMPYYGDKNNRKERIESIKISIYTYTLGLTPDEAKTFWPLYYNYQSELQNIRKEERKLKRQCDTNLNGMTDKNIESNIDKLLNYQDQELQLKKKYYGEFEKVLPIRKVALLPKAESEVRRALQHQQKERNNEKWHHQERNNERWYRQEGN